MIFKLDAYISDILQLQRIKTIQRINKTKSCFFKKINKIDKPLAKLIKRCRDSIQINKIRNEKGDIRTDNEEIKNINKKPNILISKTNTSQNCKTLLKWMIF